MVDDSFESITVQDGDRPFHDETAKRDTSRLCGEGDGPAVRLSQLRYLDVFRTRSFWSVSYVVRNSLTFLQLVEADSFNRRAVKEHVFSRAVIDKTKPLVGDSFDCAFCHFLFHFK